MKIYQCKQCGDIVIEKQECCLNCCNENMTLLEANEVDAAREKHIPVCEIEANKYTVKVGDVEHPSSVEHYIMWILLEEKTGYQIKYLQPEESPSAIFYSDNAVALYAYCNLHGLWKKEL